MGEFAGSAHGVCDKEPETFTQVTIGHEEYPDSVPFHLQFPIFQPVSYFSWESCICHALLSPAWALCSTSMNNCIGYTHTHSRTQAAGSPAKTVKGFSLAFHQVGGNFQRRKDKGVVGGWGP